MSELVSSVCGQGSSPDDVALVEAAAAVGVVFKEANSEGMTIQLGEKTVFYKVVTLAPRYTT